MASETHRSETGHEIRAGRALTVIHPSLADHPPGDRPLASFVTHLIACQRRLPAFRKAGRAEPEPAARSYEGRPARARRTFDLVV